MPHLERLIREGIERRAATIAPDVEASFASVVREARRRRWLRSVRVSAFVVVTVLAVSMFGPRLLSSSPHVHADTAADAPVPSLPAGVEPTSDLPRTEYARVVRPGLAVVRSNGFVGRWTIQIDGDGVARFRPPPAFEGRTAWRLEVVGNELTTSLFDDGLCRHEPTGSYRWTRISGFLVLDLIADSCDARVWILTSSPWSERSPDVLVNRKPR
jgi:hypothetical protein